MADTPDDQVRELAMAREHRRAVEREMTMSQRLAALHELCRHMAGVANSAPKK
jgi:hypothetical protein